MKETWKVQESQSGKPNYNIVGDKLGGKYKIARVPFMAIDEPITKETYTKLKQEALGHAKLIAAAPELLDTLQDGVELMEYLTATIPDSKLKKALNDWVIIAGNVTKKALS